MPGNRTTLRTGTMISASSGSETRHGLALALALRRECVGPRGRVGAGRDMGSLSVGSFTVVPCEAVLRSLTISKPSLDSRVPVSSRASGNGILRSK